MSTAARERGHVAVREQSIPTTLRTVTLERCDVVKPKLPRSLAGDIHTAHNKNLAALLSNISLTVLDVS